MIIINGRPRHPQSQGCVERANGDLELKLGKWLEENEGKGWVAGLQHVTYAMNTSVSETTGKSPYEVVFGQSPRTHCATFEILAEQGILCEEEIADMFEENEPLSPVAPHRASNDTSPNTSLLEDNGPLSPVAPHRADAFIQHPT